MAIYKVQIEIKTVRVQVALSSNFGNIKQNGISLRKASDVIASVINVNLDIVATDKWAVFRQEAQGEMQGQGRR
jgi:hypothetical protein